MRGVGDYPKKWQRRAAHVVGKQGLAGALEAGPDSTREAFVNTVDRAAMAEVDIGVGIVEEGTHASLVGVGCGYGKVVVETRVGLAKESEVIYIKGGHAENIGGGMSYRDWECSERLTSESDMAHSTTGFHVTNRPLAGKTVYNYS
jgi:hypothetical protein